MGPRGALRENPAEEQMLKALAQSGPPHQGSPSGPSGSYWVGSSCLAQISRPHAANLTACGDVRLTPRDPKIL